MALRIWINEIVMEVPFTLDNTATFYPRKFNGSCSIEGKNAGRS